MDAEDRLDLIVLVATGNAWEALLTVGRTLLDEFYPQDIFKGGSPDLGPQYVAALREVIKRIDAERGVDPRPHLEKD